RFELPKKFFDDAARNDHDDDRLQIAVGMRQHMEAPNDLRHWHRRDLFELEFDHGQHFVEIALGRFSYAQEALLGWQPRHVWLGWERRRPSLGHTAAWQRRPFRSRLCPAQKIASAARVKLPDLATTTANFQHVT